MRALDALRDERNVTRAAQRLSRTQPAVSAMLTRLRESFGDPLFVRSQRGIVPIERALQLAVHLKQVLSEIEQMLQPRAFEPGEAEMTLTLASTDCALRAVVVPFLARLQAQLESGDVDMALITPPSARDPGVHQDARMARAHAPLTRASMAAGAVVRDV